MSYAELVARLRGGGHLHVEAATALETLERERDGLREANEHANRMQRLTMDARQAAEAQVAKLKEALEPFAGIGELIELETEGFSDSDEFELLFGDDLRFDRIAVGKFRRAREALKDTPP